MAYDSFEDDDTDDDCGLFFVTFADPTVST
jgi:hypothetical protein